MRVSQAVEDYRYSILNLSPKTQDWYVQKLGMFAAWCEQEQITLESLKASHVRRFIEDMRKRTWHGQPISTYTLHGYTQVVKGFLSWASREDGLEDIVSEKTARRVEMPHVDQKVIETFSQDQIKRLFAACEREFRQTLVARDKAVLSILLDTGIRASELIGLTLDNVFVSPQDAYIRVFGKGRKEREVGLGKESRIALSRYLTRYRHVPIAERHVFLSRFNQPLTVSGLDDLLHRLRDWGRVTGVRCSAHTFRHTFAVNYLQAGGDVYTLSRLLGHTSVQVTERYLRAYRARDARKNGLSVLDRLK